MDLQTLRNIIFKKYGQSEFNALEKDLNLTLREHRIKVKENSGPNTKLSPESESILANEPRCSKILYYLNIAKAVSARSTCLRRKYGAIIVKDDRIVSTGYNGAPRGAENCCDVGSCKREQLGIKSGERYELCRSVHAEQNAIIAAGYEKTNGADLYLAGFDCKLQKLIDAPDCCMMCKRVVINAGIRNVYFLNGDGTTYRVASASAMGSSL